MLIRSNPPPCYFLLGWIGRHASTGESGLVDLRECREPGDQRPHAERLLGVDNLSDPANMEIAHLVHQALKAHHIFAKDVDYVVKEVETVDDAGRPSVQPQVIIVDEFTGRLMPGRRWSDGLHEAVEAKERIKIARENQTLATITLQNYFRMYDKLSGMTGTAATEAEEFAKIYKLDVTVIPTNRPIMR